MSPLLYDWITKTCHLVKYYLYTNKSSQEKMSNKTAFFLRMCVLSKIVKLICFVFSLRLMIHRALFAKLQMIKVILSAGHKEK
jgi:hypothetical protein